MINKHKGELPILGLLPSKWRIVEFEAVLEGGTRNGIYKPKQFHGDGDKIVNMGELFSNPRLHAIPMQRILLSEDEHENFGLKVGDLLFARRSLVAEGAGKCSIVCDINEPTTFESSIIRARPNTKIADSMYLYYVFQSRYGAYILDTIRRQVAVAGITGKDLVKLNIPLPPLDEQQSIAHILSTIDDKIELNYQMNETLESLAKAIFKSWFLDFDPVRAKMEGREPYRMSIETAALFPGSFEDSTLGKVPRGWNVKNLPEVIEINPQRYLSKGQSAPYLEMSNMPTSSARALAWEYREFSSGMKFMNGDVLLARITPCLENGKTAYIDFLADEQVGWGSTEYIVFCSKPPLPNEYAYFLARSDELRSHAIQNMIGTSGRQRVPAECFKAYPIVVPPEKIAAQFGEIVRPFMLAIKQYDEESRTLTALRDTLLPKLLSGEIKVKDAEKFLEDHPFTEEEIIWEI